MLDTQEIPESLKHQLKTMLPNQEWMECQRIPSVRNSVYKVKTKQQEMIIKCDLANTHDSLEREFKAIHTIHRQGGPVPRPIPLENESLVRLNDQEYVVRAYEFIKGDQLYPTESSFYSLGTTIAHFHNASDDMDKPSWAPEMTVDDLIYQPIQAVERHFNDQKILATATDYASKVAEILEANISKDWIGFTHGDAHHMNAIQQKNGAIILIDLEDVCWQWRGYDLATAIWGTFGRGGSASIWNELIGGYTSVRSLSDEEARLIRFLIFARHIWWLGLHARHWQHWPQRYTKDQFFGSGLELLNTIGKDVCGL